MLKIGQKKDIYKNHRHIIDKMQNKEKSEEFQPPSNPFVLFDLWMKQAETTEITDPNAMCLATADKNSQPSARMVLLKGLDQNGFVFYTNSLSHKGEQLAQNNKAALCFHWKTLAKQVRIEGYTEEISAKESDIYFHSRPRNSQIGAWASKQSCFLGSFQELKDFVGTYEQKFKEQKIIPRPDHWKGYCVKPQSIEFWIDGEFRLHQRYLYTLQHDGSWHMTMLYP